MRVHFLRAGHGPKNLLAEAEVFFDDMTVNGAHAVPSPFAKLKLSGFKVWQGQHGVFVTLPGRAFGAGSDRRFFDYVRSDGGPDGRDALYRLKGWLAEEYKAWAAQPTAPQPRTRHNPDEAEF